MVWMQRKLVSALGTVKDQTKIGLTKVSLKNNRMRHLDIAIVKATSHNADVRAADDEKYATEVFHIISAAPDAVVEAAAALTQRFEKTRRWVVALKCVRLLHRLLRVSNGRFVKDILDARAAGLLKFNFSGVKEDYLFSFVRAYSWFVEEAIDGQIGSLQAVEANDKVMVNLIDRSAKLQHLLDCALICLPSGAAKRNGLVLVAFEPVVRESFRLYAEICASIATWVDRFFDMHRSQCAAGFEIYKKAALQSHELAAFYESCKSLGACGGSDYPAVEKISDAEVDKWEGFITQRPGRETGLEIQCETECESLCYESLCSPSPDNRLPEEKRLKDLITFDNPFSSPEEKNEFALALFSETKITNEWVGFESPKPKHEENINSCSWELALDMSAASASSSSSFSFEDPFAASAGIAPPSYVEMEDVRRKYASMLEEQQFWQNYQNMAMRGYIQVQYRNPFCVPVIQAIPLGMPGSHATLQVYK